MSKAGSRCALCVGSLELINGMSKPCSATRVVLLEVPPAALSCGANTALVRLNGIEEVEYRVIDGDGEVHASGTAVFGRVFEARRANEALSRTLSQASNLRGSATALFLVVWSADETSRAVYGILRCGTKELLFIRLAASDGKEREYSQDRASGLWRGWLANACALHASHSLFLSNHQCYYKRLFDGLEIEIKYTVEGSMDVWELATRLHTAVSEGRLSGYIPEYGDEFQAWDYPTRLFEITEPPSERGYVAFIPMTTGQWVVKAKRYAEDALVRNESILRNQVIDGSLEEYVTRKFRGRFRKLPALRRVRYDVNFESLATGHVYGIFFDCCSVIGAEHIRLFQCELEYLRTRSILTSSEREIRDELRVVEAWLTAFLEEQGVRFQKGYYSKLSFLRELVSSGIVPNDPAPEVLS